MRGFDSSFPRAAYSVSITVFPTPCAVSEVTNSCFSTWWPDACGRCRLQWGAGAVFGPGGCWGCSCLEQWVRSLWQNTHVQRFQEACLLNTKPSLSFLVTLPASSPVSPLLPRLSVTFPSFTRPSGVPGIYCFWTSPAADASCSGEAGEALVALQLPLAWLRVCPCFLELLFVYHCMETVFLKCCALKFSTWHWSSLLSWALNLPSRQSFLRAQQEGWAFFLAADSFLLPASADYTRVLGHEWRCIVWWCAGQWGSDRRNSRSDRIYFEVLETGSLQMVSRLPRLLLILNGGLSNLCCDCEIFW